VKFKEQGVERGILEDSATIAAALALVIGGEGG